MPESQSETALQGVKILDFSTLLPGPYASLLLADLGAEVLHIAAPGRRDLVTEWMPVPEGQLSPTQAWLGRGKQEMFLNLKKPEAAACVRRLMREEGYNVILEQFRPGVMSRFGLDYESLKEEFPELIYCSLTGYGQTGPLRDRAGHDINYLARSGHMAAAGRKEGGPVLYNLQLADVAAGAMNSVAAILAALYSRSRTGKGQYIDIAMLDGLVPLHAMDGACFLAGAPVPERESQLLNGGSLYDFYETRDGRYFSVGSLEPQFRKRLLEALELPEDAGKATVKARFLDKTFEEWRTVFAQADACVEPVLTLQEAAADPHLRERGLFPQVASADGSRLYTQLGCPLKLTGTPAVYRHAGRLPGADTREILGKMGYSAEEMTVMTT